MVEFCFNDAEFYDLTKILVMQVAVLSCQFFILLSAKF